MFLQSEVQPKLLPEDDQDSSSSPSPVKTRFRVQVACEFVGSFILSLSAFMHQGSDLHADLQPFAVAATVAIIVWVGIPISGAHYNPSVTLAFACFWRGDASGAKDTATNLAFIPAQLLGALTGAATSDGLGGYSSGLPLCDVAGVPAWSRILVGEALATALFNAITCYTVVAKPGGFAGPSILGLAVIALIFMFRDSTGAFFNPALAFGLAVSDEALGKGCKNTIPLLVMYWFAQLTGGALAGFAVGGYKRETERAYIKAKYDDP